MMMVGGWVALLYLFQNHGLIFFIFERRRKVSVDSFFQPLPRLPLQNDLTKRIGAEIAHEKRQ